MKKLTIDGDVYVREKNLKNKDLPIGDDSNPFLITGKNYFIRTVTHYFTGCLIWVGEKEIALQKVAWIADTGRFNEFLEGKTVNEGSRSRSRSRS